MNRDLRFYFLVIGLPAFLLALGGLRLLNVESSRAYTLGRDALQAKATLAAADVRRRIREHVDGVRERAEQLPEWTEASFTSFVKTEPLVRVNTADGSTFTGNVSIETSIDGPGFTSRASQRLSETRRDCLLV